MLIKMTGFAFVSAAAGLLLHGSRFEKYVKAVLGMIFIVMFLSDLPSFENMKNIISDIEMSEYGFEEEREKYDEELRDRVVRSCEEKIMNAFESKNIPVKSLIIDFNGDYTIKLITVYPENIGDGSRIHELLTNDFEIDKEVVRICENR